jgi:hypothetical protein
LVLATLATGTGLAPLFHSVTTRTALVRPTPVVGKAVLPQVMTNVDGVVVDGDVVLLEQPEARIASETTTRLSTAGSIVATPGLAKV